MELLGFTIRRTPPVLTGADADVLESAVHALGRRVSALESRLEAVDQALSAARIERADWLERIEHLYNRIRTRAQRAAQKDEQAALLDPPEQVSVRGDVLALRRQLNR